LSTALVPYVEMERMAHSIAKSGLFGVKTPDQALALMVIAQAEGRHPGSVANDYHVIEGRPSLKADTMLQRYIAAGGTVKWTCYTTKRVAAIFTHPASGSIEIEWTIEMAQSAKLTTKDNWVKYPRAMLRSRVISEGVRTSYPGVSNGIYTPEEIEDMVPSEPLNVSPGAQGQEDSPRVVEGEVISGDPQPRSNGTAPKVNDGQLRIIRKKLDNTGVRETDLLAKFEIDELEQLPFEQVNDCLHWISTNAP
jgi:hypothetical protein